MNKTEFMKTKVTIEIVHLDTSFCALDMTLQEITNALRNGDCAGGHYVDVIEPLPPGQVRPTLGRLGADTTFFDADLDQYDRAAPAEASEAQPWKRDEASTFLMLELVDTVIPKEVIATWTDDQCREAEDWAAAVHFKASDNDVVVPPRPAHVTAAQPKAVVRDYFDDMWDARLNR